MLLLAMPAAAQQSDSLLNHVIGSRVKVYTKAIATPYEGKLVRVFSDSLFIGNDSAATSRFAIRDVHIIEKASGRRPTQRSTAIGALAGTIITSTALFVDMSRCKGELCGLGILFLPAAAGTGLVGGALLGAAIGETHWKRIWP